MELILRSCFLVGGRAHNLISYSQWKPQKQIQRKQLEKNYANLTLNFYPLTRHSPTFQRQRAVGFFYQPKFDSVGRKRCDDRPGQY